MYHPIIWTGKYGVEARLVAGRSIHEHFSRVVAMDTTAGKEMYGQPCCRCGAQQLDRMRQKYPMNPKCRWSLHVGHLMHSGMLPPSLPYIFES